MKKIFVIVLVFILIVIGISIFLFNRSNTIIIDSDENKKLLNEYNENLEIIKNDLEYISVSNYDDSIQWYEFKNSNIDENLLNVINMLIRDIGTFYIYATDDGTTYSYSNYLSKFDSYQKISESEFNKIINNYNSSNMQLLSLFDKYNDYFVNDNLREMKILKIIVSPMIGYSRTIYNNSVKNYNELLVNEYNKIFYIKNITNYLRIYLDSINNA